MTGFQPPAGLGQGDVPPVHDQVDGAAVGIAGKAVEGVATHMEVERGMPVFMKRAAGQMAHHGYAQVGSHSLDGQAAKGFQILYHFASVIWVLR